MEATWPTNRLPRSEAPRAGGSVFADDLSARRFRFGGMKEAAGVADAVILAGIMEIEYSFWICARSLWVGVFGDGDEVVSREWAHCGRAVQR